MLILSGGPNGEPSLTFKTVYLAEVLTDKLPPPLWPPTLDPWFIITTPYPITRIRCEARGKRKMDLNENSGKDRASITKMSQPNF